MTEKLDLSVIILTYNEEIHIRRCIENILPIAKDIYLVDSFSTDKTVEIAESLEAKVFKNKWENNYAKQFNWGLDNLPIKTKWILRLDADEYLTSELKEELLCKIPTIDDFIKGIIFKRRHIFLGKWIKKGTYPVKLLRLFKNGEGICEQRLMDEHIQLIRGKSIEFENDFVDENLNDISWWSTKHIGYAIREAVDLIDIQLNLNGTAKDDNKKELGRQAIDKRKKKHKYAQSPLFLRSFLYFCYRYFFKLGFTEGKEGFLWHFLQGWWYRTLVDAKVFEIYKACGKDRDKIKIYLKEHYNITL